MFEKNLLEIGLSNHQAKVYETLLGDDYYIASVIQRKTGISRPLVYRTLDQLIGLGLVRREDKKNQVSRYFAEHPYALERVIEEKRKETKDAEFAYFSAIEGLVSNFRDISGLPGIQTVSGVEGNKILTAELRKYSGELLLIRSIYSKVYPEVVRMIEDDEQDRVKRKMSIRTIMPFVEMIYDTEEELCDSKWSKEKVEETLENDKQIFIERKYVPKEVLTANTQIMVFGNKVSLTTYRKPWVTTILEHPDITQTFKALFEMMWILATNEHKKLFEKSK